MTVPVLPESAPFTPAQRGWLNGFFAGVFGLDRSANGFAGTNGVAHFSSTHVVSTNGHVAVPVEKEESFPWHDPGLPLEDRLKLADGKPHERMLMAAMAQLDCGSCGYVCQTYAEAIARGEDTDLTKCSPGGKDTTRKLKELVANRKSLPTLSQNGHAGSNGHAKSASSNGKHNGAMTGHRSHVPYDRKNPFPAALLKCVPLTQPGSVKDIRFVSYNLRGSGLTYEVGDAVGVYPENCPEIVDAILAALGARGDEPIPTPDGRTVYSYEALTKNYAITKVSEGLVAMLARTAVSQSEANVLQALIENDPDGILETWDVLDLLQHFPSARPPIGELIAALPPLQPRLYSISSSLKTHPEEVHLTVGVVRYKHRDRVRKGVASTFMADLLAPRQRAKIFIQSAHGFRLPTNGDTPVIMVGPGTGIAPFRAFLQEREATGAKGKNWLFFGDQRRDCDFLYRDEITAYVERGVLGRLDTAFSRDQADKLYVQHRMLERAAELWSWLNDGAHFYVCGDARRMAHDVDRTLQTIVAEQGRMSTEDAKDYVQQLTRDKRYQRDVY
jgi:sulfite reductase (NADPH) flavoprotein alpha-component